MRTLILAAAAMLASACTPMAGAEPASPVTPDQATPGQSVDATSCAARGGEIRRVGRMQSEQCIILYADAGKPCSDGDDCLGDCRTADEKRPDAGTVATGQCSADSSRFGCHTTIENGAVANTLCVD